MVSGSDFERSDKIYDVFEMFLRFLNGCISADSTNA